MTERLVQALPVGASLSDGEIRDVITLDEGKIKSHVDRVVRATRFHLLDGRYG